ncbi:MAG: hypothetical protein MI861_07610, partial [Pirellulales bacterium]|nr:hypothetical protein [Pirellulales bacterium]
MLLKIAPPKLPARLAVNRTSTMSSGELLKIAPPSWPASFLEKRLSLTINYPMRLMIAPPQLPAELFSNSL